MFGETGEVMVALMILTSPGETGEVMVALMVMMAVTSTGSAEVIAVTSILVYDIYQVYLKVCIYTVTCPFDVGLLM